MQLGKKGMDQTMESNKKENINRARLWQVIFFSFNNSATNTNLAMMAFFMVFTQNALGMASVLVGGIATGMRVFDAVTDPIVGFLIDKTDGKFGKYRPYMVIGSVIMNISMIAIFFCPNTFSETMKMAYIIGFYAFYVIGYTCQTCVTKGGQTAITNDPKQRPVFTISDSIASSLVNAGLSFFLTTLLAPQYEGGLLNPLVWQKIVFIAVGIQTFLTVLAIIGIWEKDRTEYFGFGQKNDLQFSLKEFGKLFMGNRGLRYLMISANTEKIGWMIYNSTVVYFYANILVNSSLQGALATAAIIPTVLASTVGPMIARKKGMKKIYVISNVCSLIFISGILLLRPNAEYGWPLLVLIMFERASATVSVYLSNPMIADCADYELYRTGRYIPGMVGSLFSFADKFVSSLSTFILGVTLAIAGYGDKVIIPNVSAEGTLRTTLMVCMFVIPAVCHVVSLVSMKFYPLDGKMMLVVQTENAVRKQKITY